MVVTSIRGYPERNLYLHYEPTGVVAKPGPVRTGPEPARNKVLELTKIVYKLWESNDAKTTGIGKSIDLYV